MLFTVLAFRYISGNILLSLDRFDLYLSSADLDHAMLMGGGGGGDSVRLRWWSRMI